MKVKLLRYTPDGEKLLASAGRLCYSEIGIEDIEKEITDETVERMLSTFVDIGHESPLEHVSFTFGIEGVSRALSHQLVRHRIASYSQQSQRYVSEIGGFEYITPSSQEVNTEVLQVYDNCMKDLIKTYDKLINLGLKEEDARYILPNATETKIVFTMNARTLLHFFRLRSCNRAQWEIREMAELMIKEVKSIYPTLFKKAGPSCISGPCPEGKMTCGKIKEVREKYE